MLIYLDRSAHRPVTPGDPTPQPPGDPAPAPEQPPVPPSPPPVRAAGIRLPGRTDSAFLQAR